MAERILYPQFLDQLEPTKYPFGAQASLRNDNGDTILEGLFLDAHLYPIGGLDQLYMSQVVITFDRVTIYIGDVNSTTLASGSFLITDVPDSIRLQDQYNRPAGIIVSEKARLASLSTWGVGTHVFAPYQSEFAITCCWPTPEIGLRGILLADGSVFTGHVWMIGDYGVTLTASTVIDEPTYQSQINLLSVIRVDILGDPLFRRRLCGANADLFVSPQPISTIRVINGDTTFDLTPDVYGNLKIQMNDALSESPVLRIYPTQNGLVFETVGQETAVM